MSGYTFGKNEADSTRTLYRTDEELIAGEIAGNRSVGLSMRHRVYHVVHTNLGAKHGKFARVARVVQKFP